jgi:hypothetical protein
MRPVERDFDLLKFILLVFSVVTMWISFGTQVN